MDSNFTQKLQDFFGESRKKADAKYFVFNRSSESADILLDDEFQEGKFNVATFEKTLKMKNVIKQ